MDDVITIPVSVRSEKYAPVSRNVIITVTDKDVVALEDVMQESTTYGQTLSNPVYTAPVMGGTESFSYSGKLANGTEYAASATAPDEAGHYTVKVTYETDDTRYIGKADFAIYPADLSKAEVTLGEQKGVDGIPHEVVIDSVTVSNKALVKDVDYAITDGGSATEIENTVATLTGKGYNCTGTKTFTWSLVKQTPAVSDFTLPVLPVAGYDYTGEAHTVPAPVATVTGTGAVTVYYEGTGGTEYAKTTEAPTNAGSYTVTFDVAEGTKYQAAEGLSIGTLKINKANYAGETETTVYMRAGEASTGVSVTLPEIPEGSYGNISTSCAWIESSSLKLEGRTLTFDTTADAFAGPAEMIEVEVDGLTNYENFNLVVKVKATNNTETAITFTGEGITDGKLTKTYGDESFILTAVAAQAGNDSMWMNWSSSSDSVVSVNGLGDENANVYVNGIGEAVITVEYQSDSTVGIGRLLVTVDKRGVTITGLDTENKDYDGTLTAKVNGTAALVNGLASADEGNVTVDTSLATAQFDNKNAGTGKTVTFDGVTLLGANAKNYEITEINTAQANISPISVTANVSAVSRAYEKDNVNVTLAPGAVAGVIGSDKVSVDVTNATATMTDDAVGTDKAVEVSGVALTGDDAANYTLSAQPTGVTVTIQKAVWTKTTALTEAQAGEAAEFDLTDYIAPDGKLGTVTVTEGADALENAPALSGNKLTYQFKADTPENTLAEVTIPVEDATSYNDYTLTVTLKTLHDHVIEPVAAKAPTCTENGNKSHFKCSVCGKLFSDAQGENEVSLTSVLLPALGYDWGEWEVVTQPTETTPGEEQRVCKNDPTHVETRVIPALNHEHTLVHHDRVEATETTPGNIEYWECSDCHRYFTDSEGKNEVNWEDIVIPVKIVEPVNEEGFKAVFDESIINGENAIHKTGEKDGNGNDIYYVTYTGSALKPAVIVTNNGKRLVEGTDYTLKYANNVNASTPASGTKKAIIGTVTVTGKGFYSGKQVLNFTVAKKPISDPEIAVGSTIIEKGKAANPVVTYLGNVLKKGKDYTVGAVTDGEVTITGEGNFGSSRMVKVTELEKNEYKSEYKKTAIKVTLAKVSKTYNGKPQTLTYTTKTTPGELTVKNANGDILDVYNELTGEGDYFVTYSANVDAGTVEVTVTGRGAYSGSVKKSFKIALAKDTKDVTFTVKTDKTSYAFVKTGVKPQLTVTGVLQGGTEVTLVEGRDYKITYSANKKVGTGKCKLTFLGNYKGAKYTDGTNGSGVTASYNVVSGAGRTDISKAKVTLVQDNKAVKSVAYTGNAITFSSDIVAGTTTASVKDVQLTLKVGKNTISASDVEKYFNIYYADNVEKGKATIILSAKSDVEGQPYIGACSGTFTISNKVIGK